MDMVYTCSYQSPLGGITLASDGSALIGLWFDGQKYYADAITGKAQKKQRLPVFEEAAKWLDLYFSGKDPDFTPPILMQTSAFRKAVWRSCWIFLMARP